MAKHADGFRVWQTQLSSVQCKCGCGEFVTNRIANAVAKGLPRTGYVKGHIWKGKKLPESAKEKMRANHADVSGEKNPNYGKGLHGAKNPNWQGGKKFLYGPGHNPIGINTRQDLEFRKMIRERDGSCVLCGARSRRHALEVHHIVSWVDSEEGRFDPMNCVTLCKSCHARADNAHHKDAIRPMLLAYLESV